MCRFKIGFCVIITLIQIHFISGDLSIDQIIQEGNRKREIEIRLIGGVSELEGRVEIRYNSTWGTVCDNGFNRKAAKVVCHMLGYRRRGAIPYKQAAYGEGKGQVWLDKLSCRGNEKSLRDCHHLPWGSHNCGHKEDAGVKCQKLPEKKVKRKKMVTIELDMVVVERKRHEIFHREKSNRTIKDPSNHWNKDIYYEIGKGIDTDAELLIRDALDEWESYSCLNFSESKDVFNEHNNQIVFTSNKDDRGCASIYVGMKQGSQEIHIAKDCLHREIILHEVGHALGLHHEHNRADRDKYIKIHNVNVEDGYEGQFQKRPKDEYEDFNKLYDYKSIMHYGQFLYSRNESQDLITIETLKPEFQDIIGKAKHPSFLDYKNLNDMFGCSTSCGDDVECPAGGFLGRNCHCYCEENAEEKSVTLCAIQNDKPEVIAIVRKTKYVNIAGETASLECYAENVSGRVTLFWSRATGLPSGSSQDNGILTIPNVQPSYAGNYVCTGTDTDSGRVSTAVAVLEVKIEEETEAPTVSLEPEKVTIPMGTTGTLRCKVTGKPEPKVTWIKSREELSSNHQVNGNVLRITQATMADRGIYVCRAENAAGLDQDWTVVEVERRMRPKIDLYPNTTQRVAVGSSALFQCRVMDGDPPPTITWSRVGGAPMPADKVETMENGVIMFKQVTQAEQGGYICAAENEMGTTTATATLIVEGPPTITIQPSKTVYALIGQRVTLECTADGDPLPAVYWIEPVRRGRGDVPLEVDPVARQEVEYGTAIVNIASVEREDQGTYTCVASNTGGRTEDRVQLVVREGETRGVSISGPSTLSVVEGQSVELICTAAELRNPVIRWRRREGVLPAGHSVRNGILTLPRFRSEYAGEYICSTTVQQQSYEASVFIIITVAPRLTISPQRVTSRAGDTIQLRCTASGGGPFNIEWSRIGAQMNPSATERDGVLEIRQVTAADAGRYRCVVQSSSGTNDGYAIVEIEVPPSVVVEQRDVYTEENRIARLRCDVTGSPTPVVRWEKEGDQLPAQHKIQDGVLTIYGVREEDAGRYICTASSSSGSSRDYAVLHVTTDSTIDNRGENVDTQVVNVGDRVSMECIVTGTPLPTITWSRDDGPLPKATILGDGILIIPQARIEDAGTYTCLAVNEAGSISSKVVLYVRVNTSKDDSQPLISAPSASTAALGDSAKLVCDASGYPSPDITWFRKDGEMPSDYTIVDGDLYISRVRPEDAGTYVCHAENEYGRTDTPVSLNVGDLVPYFSQNPTSYISYPPMNDVYLDFDILLSLKPESTEGMVLYNGQYEDGGGDFVCFGLNEGYPEFRFDVGSGPAIIRGNKTLPLNEWHTIKLTRDRKKGSMVVNEEPAYTGESPGYFTGLDLEGKMYLGSVPNYDNIPRVTGFREGFVGSISEVRLKDIELNLGAEALEVVGVNQSNTCSREVCLNSGNCVPANTRYGFKCICAQGYTGYRCEEIGERCYPGSCGRGRCYNLEGRSGFRCICPLGKTGMGCQADVAIINPFFNRTSFISFPPSEDALFALQIQLEFKPQSLSDGIILYEGNDEDGTGDFMAIIQKDGYLEFRFDTGSGPAIIRSRNPLRVNEWTRVTATRKNREGTLVVNDDDPVTGTSPGSTVGLNLKLPLYLGGPDPTATVSPSTGVSRGFIGCVAELTVNDVKIDLLNDALESANIVDCGERRLCARQPCENDAICEDLPGPDYRCICPGSHTGKNCEFEINICLTNSPCMNGAPCSITNTGYRCDCPLGYAGDNCEYAIDINTQFKYAGDGLMELPKDLLPHAKTQERQTISFNIRTTQQDGLIFWQGEQGGRPLRGGDHISIGLKGGYIEFSYEMGSGPALIMSRKRVDDGKSHSVSVERLGRSGNLKVDDQDTVYGDSQGYLQMLNADGNIYLGGVSLTEVMTDGKFTDNFIGCIDSVYIHGKGPLESRDAISGYNVQACSP